MSWQTEVEQAVTGLRYTMVETERSAGGLLRVYIEHPGGEPAITVDDCERVTRHLQYVLEVHDVDYQRLEVSSPGLDRPLKSAQDYERFLGEKVELVFKKPVEMAAADGKAAYQQKRFTGRLEAVSEGGKGWMLLLELQEEPPKGKVKKGAHKNAIRKKNAPLGPVMALGFTLDEVREARLVPMVNFRGRGAQAAPVEDAGSLAPSVENEPDDELLN